MSRRGTALGQWRHLTPIVSPGLVAAACVVKALLATPLGLAQPSGPESLPAPLALPRTIPIFPLEDVVLFPNTSRPLHIFETRYRDMVADALAGDRIVGMVLLQPGYEADYEGRPPIFEVGCAGEITDVEELPDGRYLIVLRGLVKFRVTSENDSRSYRLAAVEAMAEPLDDRTRGVLSDRRDQLAQMVSSIAPDSPLFPPSLSDEEFVDTLAQVLTLDPVDRQALLEQRGSVARADALVEIMLRRRSVPL